MNYKKLNSSKSYHPYYVCVCNDREIKIENGVMLMLIKKCLMFTKIFNQIMEVREIIGIDIVSADIKILSFSVHIFLVV